MSHFFFIALLWFIYLWYICIYIYILFVIFIVRFINANLVNLIFRCLSPKGSKISLEKINIFFRYNNPMKISS
jgi:hypothetical protein